MKSEFAILRNFYGNKKLKFSELKGNLESNFLSYHLNKFIREGILEKKGEFYLMTSKGEEVLCYLDKYSNFSPIKQPIHDVFLMIYKNRKWLVQRRRKRPFLGILMPIGGKILSGESIFETVKKKLFEDTGLEGDLFYKGVIDTRTYNGKNFLLHHVLNVFLVKNVRGNLKENTPKGDNLWITEKDYFKQKNLLTGMKEHLEVAKCKNFMFLDLNQHMKKGKFIKTDVVRKIKF